MIESRCGLLCSQCSHKEVMHCTGCVQMNKPFWADACPIKTCCEGRALPHCGACSDFPCQLLTQFAYDETQGDGGQRIQQCAKWRELCQAQKSM